MKYKAVILDLDGTTVPSRGDGMPTQKVVDAVNDAQKLGVKVCVATGRQLAYCQAVLDALSLKDPCVVNGGAEIVNPAGGEYLFKKYLSIPKQRHVLKICEELGFEVYSHSGGYKNPLSKSQQIKTKSAKLFIGEVQNNDLPRLLEALEAVEGIAPHPTTSWKEGDVVDVHITDIAATKKHGIEELIKILGVRKSEVIGIGDFYNDMPLFESVGCKVVMGNAPKEIKKIADFVTGSIDEDGVATAIEKLILS